MMFDGAKVHLTLYFQAASQRGRKHFEGLANSEDNWCDIYAYLESKLKTLVMKRSRFSLDNMEERCRVKFKQAAPE